jgi:hypothetical protein
MHHDSILGFRNWLRTKLLLFFYHGLWVKSATIIYKRRGQTPKGRELTGTQSKRLYLYLTFTLYRSRVISCTNLHFHMLKEGLSCLKFFTINSLWVKYSTKLYDHWPNIVTWLPRDLKIVPYPDDEIIFKEQVCPFLINPIRTELTMCVIRHLPVSMLDTVTSIQLSWHQQPCKYLDLHDTTRLPIPLYTHDVCIWENLICRTSLRSKLILSWLGVSETKWLIFSRLRIKLVLNQVKSSNFSYHSCCNSWLARITM